MTQSGTTRISAEWALWGKDARDRGYRLLRCSEGVFRPQAFIDALDRYAPGTLDARDLPQVAFSWLRHPVTGLASHLGLAIYETAEHDPPGWPERSRFDAAGREIVYVRYFCVPYDELAARSADFWQFYQTFRGQPLHGLEPRLISGELAPPEAPPPDPVEERFAQNVTAQLLTAQPVCVLGANEVPFERRLRFLDQVLSGLPYGARSQFSAATWVNSSFTGHKHRLFFASSPRDDIRALPRANSKGAGFRGQGTPRPSDSVDGRVPDVVVRWGRLETASPSVKEARDYLACDKLGDPAARASLARDTDPVSLRRDTVPGIVSQIRLGPAARRTVLELLQDLGSELRYGAGGIQAIRSYTDILSAKAGQYTDEQTRADCWTTAAQFALFSNVCRDQATRDRYYDALLDVLIDGEVTYTDFLQVEDCLGESLLQSPGLLHALGQRTMPKAGVPRLLIRLGLGDSAANIMTALRENDVPAPELARRLDRDAQRSVGIPDPHAMMPGSQPPLRPDHGHALLEPAIQYLLEHTGRDRRELRRVGYMATALFYYCSDDQARQVSRLRQILRETYGHRLSKSDIAEIFHAPGHPPTDSLLAAVKDLAPGFPEFTALQFGQARSAALAARSPGNTLPVPADNRAGQLERLSDLGRHLSERRRPVSPRAYVLGIALVIMMLAGIMIYVLVAGGLLAPAPSTDRETPPASHPATSAPGNHEQSGAPGSFTPRRRGAGRTRSRSGP